MPLEAKTEFGTARQMIHEDGDFTKPEGTELRRIDLACGRGKREGFEGVDVHNIEGVDHQWDILQFPWPLENDSVYEFNCSHFVEHIPHQIEKRKLYNEGGSRGFEDKDGLVLFMEEVYRCLQPLGTIKIAAPYYTSIRAHQDPTHCRYITEVTFSYFCKKIAESACVEHYTGDCNFEVISMKYVLNPDYISRSDEVRTWATKHYWNVVDDIEIVLRALK